MARKSVSTKQTARKTRCEIKKSLKKNRPTEKEQADRKKNSLK